MHYSAARLADFSWSRLLAAGLLCLVPFGLVSARSMIDVGIGGLAAMFLILWARGVVRWRDFDWVMKAGLVFWAVILAASLNAVDDPTRSLFFTLPWVRYVFFYGMVTLVLWRDEGLMRFAGGLLVLMLAFTTVDTLTQFYTLTSFTGHDIPENGRLTGPLSHPNVGALLYVLTLACLIWAAQDRGQHERDSMLMLIVLAITALMTSLLSGERSSTAVMLLSLGFGMALLAWTQPHTRRWAAMFGMGLVVFVLILFGYNMHFQIRVNAFFTDVGNFAHSVYGQLFEAGWSIGSSHPWLGAGVRNFEAACAPLLKAQEVFYCDVHPHNFYLEAFAGAGVPGMLAFAALVGAVVWRVVTLGMRVAAPRYAVWVSIAWLVFTYFPVMITQSYFVNWRAGLVWFGTAWVVAMLRRSGAQREA